MGEKLFFMSLAQRLASGIPAFVVEATDQHWELRAELRHFLHDESVAQRAQGGAQSQVGRVPILPAQYVHHVIEPSVGLLDRRVENVQTCRTHCITSL